MLDTCPLCGLAVAFSGDIPPETPTCNPIRSPGCWRTVAKLPKADSPERRIIDAAPGRGQG